MASDSETSVPSSDDNEAAQQNPVTLSVSGNKSSRNNSTRNKIPKKIHKSEREKRKRDHLNVLFLELSNTLEPAHYDQLNGKACILSNAVRLLRDLLTQVESLKKENTALLSESNYVSSEKDELRVENSTIEAQIKELKSEVQERTLSMSAWKLDHLQPQHDTTSTSQEDHVVMPAAGDPALHPPPTVLQPLLVVPLHHHDLQLYQGSDASAPVHSLQSNISRPLARYPSSSDAWPSQILAKQQEQVSDDG